MDCVCLLGVTDCVGVSHFDQALPKGREEFDATIKHFKAAAEVMRIRGELSAQWGCVQVCFRNRTSRKPKPNKPKNDKWMAELAKAREKNDEWMIELLFFKETRDKNL